MFCSAFRPAKVVCGAAICERVVPAVHTRPGAAPRNQPKPTSAYACGMIGPDCRGRPTSLVE